ESCWYIKEELNQVLFVVSGRFTKEEIRSYNLLKKVIFDENIVNYTTIVRTNFPHFKKKTDCEEDIKIMIDNGGELAEVIKTCKERIIHVDNPPIDVKGERLKCNKENRKVLKEILLKNLIKFDETYKSKNFYRERHENLENFIGEKEKIIKQVKEIKSKLPRYDYGKKLVDCSDELVEGSVGIANLIQPDNFPISNAGGNIAKFGVKILSVGVNYVLDEKENQLIEKFKNKIKEDRENQEKYLSKLNFVEKKINFPEFGWLEYIELSI
ncbi:17164_t:CDS:1, partial [Rhizophagus irregularis]